jgi:SpoVK/Ycf46/Vps4 family AAA+-type ATPase
MSYLILDRQHKTTESTETKSSSKNEDFHMFENLVNVVSTVKDGKSSQNNYFSTKENKLTLSFILNILDGLDENDGRILIVTSNYFDQIDKALVRPGRIDIKLEMTNATIETINELYNHYYHEDIPEEYKSRINDYVMSPAEIVNIYRTTETSTEFLNVLIEKCSKELMNTSNSNM